jgi:hypothetical protein
MSGLDPGTILAWGRVDPYFVWAERSTYAGLPREDFDWIPMIVECSSSTDATKLAAELEQTFNKANVRKVRIPPTAGLRRFTLCFDKSLAGALPKLLSDRDLRWELGLPFASPTGIPPLGQPPERRRAPRQIVGFIDYGCAFAHAQFREPGIRNFDSRVVALWDQGAKESELRAAASALGVQPPQWLVPPDFLYGAEWRRQHVQAIRGLPINDYIRQFVKDGRLDEEACYAASGYAAIRGPVAHGTHMMDMAAGYPDPTLPPGVDPGPAPNTDIVFVQLPRTFSGQQVSGLLRTYVLDAVHYVLSWAHPGDSVTINLSYGAYAGSHDGKSIVEAALDEAIELRRAARGPTDIVIAAGNGGDACTHADRCVSAASGSNLQTLRWTNIPGNPSDQLTEVWLDGKAADVAKCRVRFTPPGAASDESAWVGPGQWHEENRAGVPTHMVIWPRKCGQSLGRKMILIAVAPTTPSATRPAAAYGTWRLDVQNRGASDVQVRAWIERDEPVFMTASGPRQAKFARADASLDQTLNSLSHGKLTITVGGFVAGSGRQPDYSGRQVHVPRPPRIETRAKCGPPANAGPKARPEWLAVCEESDALPGVAAAAVLGLERARLPGTSVAAAAATRYVVEQRRRQVPPQSLKPVPPPAYDDDEDGFDCMPRVPTTLPRRGKRRPRDPALP